MTRVGIVTTSYPRFGGDPAGHFVEAHARALVAMGYEVDVVAADGERQTATANGERQTASANGERQTATATGERQTASANGERQTVTANGERQTVTANGERPTVTANGDRQTASANGDRQTASANGERQTATATRDAQPAPHITRVPASARLFYTGGAPDALERDPARALLSAASFSARFAATLASQTRARRWDTIVAHWLAPSALAAALATPRHLPLLAIAHGGDVFTLRRLGLLVPALHALRLRRARLAFVSADLLAIARATAARSRRLLAYLDTAIVQPMAVDLDHFAALPRAPTTPPTILIAARLSPIKGVDVALAALAYLRTPAHLVIAGDGPELATLRALAATHDTARVTFLGAVTTARRDELLSRASLVVVPSRPLPSGRTEGTPLIALEALAAGVPLVASATGGLGALAPAAIVVPPDHPPLLAAAIEHALLAPPTATSLRAAVAHFGWREVANVLAPTQLPA